MSIPSYETDPSMPYGPTWGRTRPPGLPSDVRHASTPAYGRALVEGVLAAEGLLQLGGGWFAKLVRSMAQTESGFRAGIPAYNFDARPRDGASNIPRYSATMEDGRRTPGKRIVTAWGLFSFNRGAWRGLPEVEGYAFMWDVPPSIEALYPILRYERLWREAEAQGATPRNAARYVRLWQRGPALSKALLSDAATTSWVDAWGRVGSEHRNIIDTHLSRLGLI